MKAHILPVNVERLQRVQKPHMLSAVSAIWQGHEVSTLPSVMYWSKAAEWLGDHRNFIDSHRYTSQMMHR